MKKFRFSKFIDGKNTLRKVGYVSPETILVSILNSEFNTIKDSCLSDLISDTKLLLSINKDKLDTNKNLHTEYSDEDGQLVILNELGFTYSGDYNIEQLLIAKSPRIPWGGEFIGSAMTYFDETEFSITIDKKEEIVGVMQTEEVLDVLIEWHRFLTEHNL